MGKEKTKVMAIRVYESLFEKFKEACDDNYKTMSEAVRDFMQEYIKNNNDSQ